MTYEIEIKEKENPCLLHTSYSGQEMTEQELVEFFGLDRPDVEWYKIREVNTPKVSFYREIGKVSF